MKKGSIIPAWLLIIVGISLILTLVNGLAVSAQGAVVRFYFFYSKDCDDCQPIKDEFLPALVAQYSNNIEINYLDVSDAALLEQRLTLEKWRGIKPPEANTPEIYIGDQALIGAEEIRTRLPELIDEYLAQGGIDLPDLPPLSTNDPGKPVARFLLFYGDTCPACYAVIADYLPTVYEKYGVQAGSRYLEIYNDIENNHLMRGLLLKLAVPPEKQGYVPTLIIGDKVLVGGEIQAQLEGHIDAYLAQGGVDYPSLDDLPQPVEILIFFDPHDPELAKLNEFIMPLGEQYGDWLRMYGTDTSQSEGAKALAQYNAALGVSNPNGAPQVLIDRQMLVGIKEIENQLAGLIEKYKKQGGIKIPSPEELTGEPSSSTPSPTPDATKGVEPTRQPTRIVEPAQKPIYLAYFEQAGCQECARTTNDLKLIQDEYPQLIVENYAVEEHAALNEWLSQKYNVPEEKHLSSPMIFVGDDVLIGAEANLNTLMITVAKYVSTGAERSWDDFDPSQAKKNLIDRFNSFGLLTVLGAGLIDGLNPCAFATLVFFVSYLTFTGRRGRDVLLVGASFALGVFLTYLLVGVGLLRVVQSLSFFTALGRWVYLITALLCVLLATLTFRDFFQARRGQTSEMSLKLPMGLRRRIHTVIRQSAQLQAFVAVAFLTGFVVSLLELACTGQVYLPTIMFVLSMPDLAARAFFYLVLYCLMFILPLILVFVLSYFGTTSDQLSRFVNLHTPTIKFLTGLVFVGLALWMTWTLAPLFGANAPWNWVLLSIVVAIIALGIIALRSLDKRSPPARKKRRRRKPARP